MRCQQYKMSTNVSYDFALVLTSGPVQNATPGTSRTPLGLVWTRSITAPQLSRSSINKSLPLHTGNTMRMCETRLKQHPTLTFWPGKTTRAVESTPRLLQPLSTGSAVWHVSWDLSCVLDWLSGRLHPPMACGSACMRPLARWCSKPCWYAAYSPNRADIDLDSVNTIQSGYKLR
jgi:hypothetical protein